MAAISSKDFELILTEKFSIHTGKNAFFSWFSNFSNYSLLFPHVISISPMGDHSGEMTGKQFQEKALNFWGNEVYIPVKIIEWQENEKIVVLAHNPRITTIFHFDFLETNEKNSVWVWKMLCKKKKPIPMYLIRIFTKILFWKRFNFAKQKLLELFPLN